MVRKQSRRSKQSRRNRSKQSRRNRSKQSRRNRNRNRSQRGGSCAALPMNRQNFQQGGMAPIDANGLLLDQSTRIQAEVGNLDRYIAELPSVIPKQMGGRSRRNRRQRGGELADFGSSYELLPAAVVRGVNPQFHTEGQVNSLYGEHKGAQA